MVSSGKSLSSNQIKRGTTLNEQTLHIIYFGYLLKPCYLDFPIPAFVKGAVPYPESPLRVSLKHCDILLPRANRLFFQDDRRHQF